MRAVLVERLADPPELVLRDWPEPSPGPDDVLIEVRAAACNFADSLMAAGRYQVKPPLPFVPGLELAGVVRRVGANVADVRAGQKVAGLVTQGAYAEFALAPVSRLMVLDEAVSFEEAAALPISYGTAYAGLVFRATLQPGETLLVHAAAGGAGRAAVELGKALGARVIATAGGADKCGEALRAGADVAFDYRSEPWRERVLEATQGRGSDVIYDPVGGDTLDESLRCIAWNGRLVTVGFSSGRIPEISANRILLKNIAVTGVHWSAYPERDPKATRLALAAVAAAHARGELRPLISARYPLERAGEAVAALAAGRTTGKIIVSPKLRA